MRKTLLLCFIHGFKGDDNTFGGFPEHLRALVSHALPKVNVSVIVYPKFETRGDLWDCVGRFRDWLQNKVIDLEVSAGTPSPTVDPSVHTILIGHSMGGIVAAEAVIALATEQPISQSAETHGFMFPYIQAVLAFDTPYLGISPGVVAYGAENHYNTASSALTQLSGLTGGLWGGKAAADSQEYGKAGTKPWPPALPAPLDNAPDFGAKSAAAVHRDGDAAATPVWQRWGKVAMFAGAAGAMAAGGAAAYLKRDQITEGWGWVGSHLEFVGSLVRGEELKKRMENLQDMEKERDLGFANLYTKLGKGASGRNDGIRTFVSLPRSEMIKAWEPCVNDAVKDEIGAHLSMFFPRENPGYYALAERAKAHIVDWVGFEWYETDIEDTAERGEQASGLEESTEPDKDDDYGGVHVHAPSQWSPEAEEWTKGVQRTSANSLRVQACDLSMAHIADSEAEQDLSSNPDGTKASPSKDSEVRWTRNAVCGSMRHLNQAGLKETITETANIVYTKNVFRIKLSRTVDDKNHWT
ncbi:MAG: hypothetical protein M1833_007029 [Piccolia ochrophora]|nr:MAG: hypothetical protein M1833_007029 [Piccolia ochrophora]